MAVSIADAVAANWVGEISNTPGNGPIVLFGSYQNLVRFTQAFGGQAAVVFYSIKNGNNWEAGIANFDGVTGLDRDTPTATFFNGVYDDNSPSRIVLSGQSIVRCSFNTAAFENFLTKQLPDQNFILGDTNGDALSAPINDYFTIENGFENRFDSQISFDEVTRIFTIQPTVDSYRFWSNSRLYVKTTPDQLTIPDDESLHYIYFDSDSLLQSTTQFIDEIITQFAFVAVIDWNIATQKAVLVGEERHGHEMSSATHLYNHHTTHARYDSGFAPSNIVADGSGDVDIDARFSIGNGIFWDEDIRHIIADGISQELDPIAQLPILYRAGNPGHWQSTTPNDFPVRPFVGGSSRLAYNENVAGTWQQTEVNNLDFVLCHVLATNDIRMPIMAIQGQNQYGTLGSARDGANEEINNLSLGSVSVLFPEFLFICTVIYQTSNGYSNQVKGRIRSTDDGDDFVDWRGQLISAGAGAGITTHNQLAGLANDDHLQYAALSTRNNTYSSENTFLGGFNVGDPGTETGSILVNGTPFTAAAKINRFGSSVGGELIIHRHSSVDQSDIVYSRALSDDATHANVVDTTTLGNMVYTGWFDTSYWLGAIISARVDGTPGSGDMPTRIDFATSADGTASPVIHMSVRANGVVEVSGSPIVTLQDLENLPIGFGSTWKFDSSLSMADPGAGDFRLNTANMSTATFLAISKTTENGLTLDLENELKDEQKFICFQQSSGQDIAGYFIIDGTPVDNTTWMQIPIVNIDQVGTIFSNSKLVPFNFFGIGGGTTVISWGEIIGTLSDQSDLQTVLNTIVTDHGDLTGLTGDDHLQYHNDARGDIRYYTKALLDAGQLDNRYYTETESDDLLAAKVTRNHLINPHFDIWQRGTSDSMAAAGDAAYLADRWLTLFDGTGNNITVSRQAFTAGQTDVPGEPTYFYRIAQTASPAGQTYSAVRQAIEDVRTLAGKQITCWAWMKAAAAENVFFQTRQDFGVGGSADVTELGSTESVTTDWQLFTFTTDLASVSGKTIGTGSSINMELFFENGEQYQVDIAETGVVVGTAANIPEVNKRFPGEELVLCQRYYRQSYAQGTFAGALDTKGSLNTITNSGGDFNIQVDFSITMRAAPTVTIYAPDTGNSGNVTVDGVGDYATSASRIADSGARIGGTTAASTTVRAHFTASAEL